MIKEPLQEKEIKQLADSTGSTLVQMINSKGQAFKKLGISAQELDDNQALALIQENPRIMVRPVLVNKNRGITGFKEEQYQSFIS